MHLYRHQRRAPVHWAAQSALAAFILLTHACAGSEVRSPQAPCVSVLPAPAPQSDAAADLDPQCGISSCDPANDGLTDETRGALYRALENERSAEALHADVMDQLGALPPFASVVQAERRHIAALTRLLESHGEIVPAPPLPAPQPVFEGFAAACRAAIASEILTITMYDEMLQGALPDDVRCVFDRLRSAAQDRHLGAFQRCASAWEP